VWHLVRTHDLVFGWFASWHTFLPFLFAKLLGRPSILVIGGYDVANIPEIGYGHQRGGLKKWVSRRTMRFASCLVTNSIYSRDEAMENAAVKKERMHAIYHGVPDPFGTVPTGPRARMALTVGNVDRGNLRRKGHEPFVRAAALLPDVEFVVIGSWKDEAIDYLKGVATANVTFTGSVSADVLLDYYRKASVYVQPSLHEGFGLSVAEAMLAGCVPVTTGAGALPEVTGKCGVRLSAPDPAEIAQAIRTALAYPDNARSSIRTRILTRFPMKNRRDQLEQIIRPLMNGDL
jgi:glycosyltransferase involved in cell wall biosynthesis